jgi:hypothetical protein
MEKMITVKRRPIQFKHDVVVYVPVFQIDFDSNGELNSYPTFHYSYADATQDEQMACSLEPDYILELRGHFDATTKPLIIKEEEQE